MLGVFAKLQKAAFSFFMPFSQFVWLFVHMERLGSHWMDFQEILCPEILLKSIEKINYS